MGDFQVFTAEQSPWDNNDDRDKLTYNIWLVNSSLNDRQNDEEARSPPP